MVRMVWMGVAWSGYGCAYACARLGWSEPEPDPRVQRQDTAWVYNAWRAVPLSVQCAVCSLQFAALVDRLTYLGTRAHTLDVLSLIFLDVETRTATVRLP